MVHASVNMQTIPSVIHQEVGNEGEMQSWVKWFIIGETVNLALTLLVPGVWLGSVRHILALCVQI